MYFPQFDLDLIFIFTAKMSEENWGDEGEVGAGGATDLGAAPTAEMPEVKLFGRWSCDDVQVSDMSLQVCSALNFFMTCFGILM